jgi:cellulose synthase/poly-beta-1,6-N-acetylglucosamine synthase-like glycosyltransferase
LKNENAIVYTHAKASLSELIQQRKRWASKTTKYKNKSFMILGVSIWLFNVSILVNIIFAFCFPGGMSLSFLIFQLISKVGIEFIFLNQVMSFFKRKQLLVLLPILNLVHIIYMVYIGIAGNSGKYNWKGRMVK